MSYFLYLSVTGEDRICIYRMDAGSGALAFQEHAAAADSVGPLAVDPQQRFLYAGLRRLRQVQTYRLDGRTGGIKLLGSTPLDWDPTCLSTDNTGRFLLYASYRGGGVGVHVIGNDGVVRAPAANRHDTARCAHYIHTDPSNRFAFVPHVAETNSIYQYRFDQGTGRLESNEPPTVEQPANTGPRHYCHHPARHFVYMDNEQGCSVTAYRFDPAHGTLDAFQTVSTLPDGFSDFNTCAQIHMHPSGRFMYVSNRGHDSIACFGVDAETGLMNVIGHAAAAGTPRAFNLDPDGRFLFAAGQDTGRLTAFRIDQETGTLSALADYEVGEDPSWVMVLNLKRSTSDEDHES